MRFKIDSKPFSKAIAHAARCVSQYGYTPIIQTILIEASGETIMLRATDLEIGIELRLKAEVLESGSICVPAEKILNYLRIPLDGQLEVSLTPGLSLRIQGTNSTARISGVDPRSFPAAIAPMDDRIATTCGKLAGIIQKASAGTVAFMDRSPLPTESTILLTESDGKLQAVGFDGKRIAIITQSDIDADGIPKLVIPYRCWQTLKWFCDLNEKAAIAIGWSQKGISVTTEYGTLHMRQVSLSYPNYAHALKFKAPEKCVVSLSDFKPAFDRARAAARITEGSLVREVEFIFSKESLSISSGTEECSVNESMRAECTTEGVMNINSNFVADAIKAIESETITMGYGGLQLTINGNAEVDAGFSVTMQGLARQKAKVA